MRLVVNQLGLDIGSFFLVLHQNASIYLYFLRAVGMGKYNEELRGFYINYLSHDPIIFDCGKNVSRQNVLEAKNTIPTS